MWRQKQDETRQVKVRRTKMSLGLNYSAVRVQSGRGAFNLNTTADWIHSLLSSYDDPLDCDAALFRIKLPAPE